MTERRYELNERVAQLEVKVDNNTVMTEEILKCVKGSNGMGLRAQIEVNKGSIKWLTWGFRTLYGLIISACLYLWKS